MNVKVCAALLPLSSAERQGIRAVSCPSCPPRPISKVICAFTLIWSRTLATAAVVIAEHRDGALRAFEHDLIDAPLGIGAIAHDVTEEDDLIDATGFDIGHYSRERFAVGVNVGQKCGSHGFKHRVGCVH